MALVLNGTRIDRVGVVDDSADARDTISDDLRDADFIPQPFVGPFKTLNQLLRAVPSRADAVVCDHHLSPRNYAPCTGAEAVGHWYENRFPSVLITRYEKAEIEQIRRYRKGIPALIPSDEAGSDVIVKGFEVCIGEFNDHFIPARKPWVNMFRIDDVDDTSQSVQVYVVVPGWNSDEAIKLPLDMFPEDLRKHVKTEERFFAKMNLGAENQEDLYFDAIEYRGK